MSTITETTTEHEWGVWLEDEKPHAWWLRQAVIEVAPGIRTLGTKPHDEESARREFRSQWFSDPKLIRRAAGEQGPAVYEVVPYGPPPRCEPPKVRGWEFQGVTIERWGEDGEMIVARGHHAPEAFLAAFRAEFAEVNKPVTIDGEVFTTEVPEVDASDLEHRLAVFEEGWGYGDEDDMVAIRYVEADPDAIPVTVLDPT